MTELPNDAEAEKSLLGAIIVENQALASVDFLAPSDFYRAAHRVIFSAMRDLALRKKPVDPFTLREALGDSIEKCGGTAYLGALVDGVPRVSNGAAWGEIIKKKATLRELAIMGNALAKAALEDGAEPDNLVAERQLALARIARQASGGIWSSSPAAVKEAWTEMEQRAATRDGILGLRTGLFGLDQMLMGILAPQVGLIAGRLKSGKSILLLNIAENVIRSGGKVAYFSLEMAAKTLALRRLSAEAGVNPRSLWACQGGVLEERWARLAKAYGVIAGDDMRVSDKPGLRVQQILNACAALKAEQGLDLVIVDYLQLLRPEKQRAKRNEEVADLARDLADAAKELHVPILAGAQLNRESEGRKFNKPIVADIADSDEPGRACDWAVLIQREPMPAPGQDPRDMRNIADLHLAANRHGFTGVTRVVMNRTLQRFEDYHPPAEEPAKETA